MTKYKEVYVQLTGGNGNAYNIIALCREAAKRAGVSMEEISKFSTEATESQSYDEVLRCVERWFNYG